MSRLAPNVGLAMLGYVMGLIVGMIGNAIIARDVVINQPETVAYPVVQGCSTCWGRESRNNEQGRGAHVYLVLEMR